MSMYSLSAASGGASHDGAKHGGDQSLPRIKDVAQDGVLSRGILRSGWGLLVRWLEQKVPGRVQEVNRAYTLQNCKPCKHIASQIRQSQATFVGVSCGHKANAEVNQPGIPWRDMARQHVQTAEFWFALCSVRLNILGLPRSHGGRNPGHSWSGGCQGAQP